MQLVIAVILVFSALSCMQLVTIRSTIAIWALTERISRAGGAFC